MKEKKLKNSTTDLSNKRNTSEVGVDRVTHPSLDGKTTKVKYEKIPLPGYNFIRPLTKEDCRFGFHNFTMAGMGDNNLNKYERCATCGHVEKHSVMMMDTDEGKRKWKNSHKLDILQPFGPTEKDYIKYYGPLKKVADQFK